MLGRPGRRLLLRNVLPTRQVQVRVVQEARVLVQYQ